MINVQKNLVNNIEVLYNIRIEINCIRSTYKGLKQEASEDLITYTYSKSIR